MNSQYVLTQGPSREQLFDSLKLGAAVGELRVLDFWGTQEVPYENGIAKSGSSLPIEIEGVHRASKDGSEWFFWGRQKQITSGDKWVPMWESVYVNHCVGRWSPHRRTGWIRFAETSFFDIPLKQLELMTA